MRFSASSMKGESHTAMNRLWGGASAPGACFLAMDDSFLGLIFLFL